MRWIVFLGFVSQVWAATPMVFMREEGTSKNIYLLQNERSSQLTEGTHWHLYPDISADGNSVVWMEGINESDLSIRFQDLSSSRKEAWVTATPGMHLHPKFTRDGKMIFFSMATSSGSKIVYFSPDTERQRQIPWVLNGVSHYLFTPTILNHEGSGYFPRPTFDGSKVFFQRNFDGKKEIVEFDVLTSQTKVLAEGMAPSLSSDEQHILYTSKIHGSWDVWQFNRADGAMIRMTTDKKDEMAPTFDNEGHVVFASNKEGRFQLYRLMGSDWNLVVNGLGDDYAPQFAGEKEWQQSLLPTMMGPQRSSFGAINHQGKIYVCGGHKGAEHTYPPESFTDDLQVYDPATKIWKALAPRPHKAHGYQLAAKGRYLYAFGGFAYEASTKPKWKSISAIDRYDILTDTWQTIGELPRKRSSNVAVTVGDKVYLIGGWDATPRFENDTDGTFHESVDIFNLSDETVKTALWNIPSPLRRAFSATEYQGQIILVGGLGVGSSHFELLTQVTKINPVTGVATELAPLPFATFAPAAEVLGNELMVFGGMFKTGPMDYEYVPHVYALDLSTNSWRHTGRFLSETKGFSQVVPLENGLGVLGGHRYFADRDEPVGTFEFFTK